MSNSRGWQRALVVFGWIATVPGIAGLLGAAVVFGHAEWLFGCRPSGILGLSCPEDPLGWLGRLLWFSGLIAAIWFPGTLIPVIYAVVYPVVRLIQRQRDRAVIPSGPLPEQPPSRPT